MAELRRINHVGDPQNLSDTTHCRCGRVLRLSHLQQSYGRGSQWQEVLYVVADAWCGNDACLPYVLYWQGALVVPEAQA